MSQIIVSYMVIPIDLKKIVKKAKRRRKMVSYPLLQWTMMNRDLHQSRTTLKPLLANPLLKNLTMLKAFSNDNSGRTTPNHQASISQRFDQSEYGLKSVRVAEVLRRNQNYLETSY